MLVTQTAIQLKNKYIADCTTRTFHIAGCTTRNTKLFLNTLRVVQPSIQNFFEKKFVLRILQPAMYLKTICVAVYTTCCCGVVVIITLFFIPKGSRNVKGTENIIAAMYLVFNYIIMNEDYFHLFFKAKMGIC